MSTNTRRKTFATPLEFWQWAIMEPGKRKAKNQKDLVVFVDIDDTGRVVLRTSEGFDAWLEDCLCPLTAVEDEHGVIEERPSQDYITDIEAAIDIIRCMDVTCSKETREAYINTSTGLLINAMRQIADERIAAATVAQDSVHGFPERVKNYYLLPKGDK